MTTLYKFKSLSLGIIVFLGIATAPVVNAVTIDGQTCKIKVFPYDTNGQVIDRESGDAATLDSLLYPITDPVCSEHLQYTHTNGYQPSAPYKNQFPRVEDNPLSQYADGVSVPTANHEHAFYNDMIADANYYYKAALKGFEIRVYLDDDGDGTKNIDDTMVCDMPLPNDQLSAADRAEVMAALQNCETAPNQILNVYSGTTIKKIPQENNSVIIRWEFGKNGRPLPVMYGRNGDGFTVYDPTPNGVDATPLNLNSDDSQRTLGKNGSGFSVNLTTLDNPDYSIWSTTTTSLAYIQKYRIARRTYNQENSLSDVGCAANPNGWCLFSDPSGRAEPFNVGSTASIWRRTTPSDTTSKVNLTLVKRVKDANGNIVNDIPLIRSFSLFAEKTDAAAAAPEASVQRATPRRAPSPQVTPQEVVTPKRSVLKSLGASMFSFVSNLLDEPLELQLALGDRVTYTSGETKEVDANTTYRIGEETKEGYVLESVECKNTGTPDGNYQVKVNHRVAVGETDVTCRLTNRTSDSEVVDCPAGQVLDIASGRCIPETPECESYEHVEGNQCVSNCLPGQVWNGVACIDIQIEPVCEPGYILTPQGCVISGSPAGVFTKSVAALGGGNVIQTQQFANYTLNFRATRLVNDVTIREESFRPMYSGFGMTGNQGGHLTVVPTGNFIVGDPLGQGSNWFRVVKNTSAGAYTVPVCGPQSVLFLGSNLSSCYTGNPFINGVHISGIAAGESVSVEFTAKLTFSRIGPDYCNTQVARNAGFCGEQFHNTATAVDSELRNYSAFADLYTPCPYLLTRGLGDIILEQGFTYGSDINSCFSLPNIEGQIIQPIELLPERANPSSGIDVPNPDILRASNEICKKSNDNSSDNPDAYKNPFKNLSSGLCELQQSITESLTSSAIRQAISDNIVRFTRENTNLNKSTISGDDINEVAGVTLTNPNYKVYKTTNKLEVKNITPVAKGSRTFIVQGADLIIYSDIIFDEQAVRDASFKDTPSIAFIVIGGDIKIAPNVTHLDGVYVSIKDPKTAADANARGGKITTTGAADQNKSLEFNGALVGDIEPLFKSRTFAGDAKKNKGTIVINYGAWLYYNLPPVLRDLINLQQEQTAR